MVHAVYSIDEANLADGISQVTVFNERRQPVCERLYFKIPHNFLQIKTTGIQYEYAERSKVDFKVFTGNNNSYPANANLSASAYLIDSLQPQQENNIVSYLWLSTGVKGMIESPSYYFDTANADAAKAADNLMLTQGWRRFQWNDVFENTIPAFRFLPEYEGHIITGKIFGRTGSMQNSGKRVSLSVPGKSFRFSNATSADDGALLFNIDKFYGSRELVMQTNIADSNYRLFIDNPFSDKFIQSNLPFLNLNPGEANAITLRSIRAQSQNVYQPAKQDNFSLPSHYDTTAFYGFPFKTYYLDNYTRFPTMEEVMREYIKEVHVRKRDRSFYYEVFDEPDVSYFNTPPLTLIDGVPVEDVTKIINMDPLKIQRTDITASNFFKDNIEYNGIVSYATYNGDLEGYQLDPNSLVVEYDGLQYKREFYSPQYEAQQQQESRLPDYRNVLYWNPKINTINGMKNVSFYTSDVPGTYLIMLQGISDNGVAGYHIDKFVVK